MATAQMYGDVTTVTVAIDTDLSNKEYYLVNFESTGDKVVNLATDATAFPFVLAEGMDGSVTPGKGTVVIAGHVKLKIGGTVAAGDKLTSNGSGLAITTVTNLQHYGFIALEDGSANDIIDALVAPGMVSL